MRWVLGHGRRGEGEEGESLLEGVLKNGELGNPSGGVFKKKRGRRNFMQGVGVGKIVASSASGFFFS